VKERRQSRQRNEGGRERRKGEEGGRQEVKGATHPTLPPSSHSLSPLPPTPCFPQVSESEQGSAGRQEGSEGVQYEEQEKVGGMWGGEKGGMDI
jgi:hypothetical protein